MANASATNGIALEIEREGRGGWFTRLATFYLRRNLQRHGGAVPVTAEPRAAPDHARSLIRKACIKSALSGAAAGTASTTATLVTAESGGSAALLAVPLAAVAMGADVVYRSLLHVDLTCDLARTFGIDCDYDSPDDLWRLYALIFKTSQHDHDSTDPGRALVSEMTRVEGDQVGEKIGRRVLGESVAKNLIPVVGVLSSAITNYLLTQRLGDTVRRYMRYQRALRDALDHATESLDSHLDLLIEGVWFVFTADGKLTPEETVTLARLLERLPLEQRKAVQARFVEDELEWADRIETIPPQARADFLYALEVAATVDKQVGLPERKILRRAAHHLGQAFDIQRLERMIGEFEAYGVLRPPRHSSRPSIRSLL